jgi:hypothetical protein
VGALFVDDNLDMQGSFPHVLNDISESFVVPLRVIHISGFAVFFYVHQLGSCRNGFVVFNQVSVRRWKKLINFDEVGRALHVAFLRSVHVWPIGKSLCRKKMMNF